MARAAEHYGYASAQYEREDDEKSDSKPLIILHVPRPALAVRILYLRRRFYGAGHFAFALHLFAVPLPVIESVECQAALLGATSPVTLHGILRRG